MGVGTSAILGSTGKFFMPWFIPRNDNQSVFQPSVLNKLQTGRKRRDVGDAAAAAAGISLDDTAIVLEGWSSFYAFLSAAKALIY